MKRRRREDEVDREAEPPERRSQQSGRGLGPSGESAEAMVARLATADAGTRRAEIAWLQQAGGNATVARLLDPRAAPGSEAAFDAAAGDSGGGHAISPHAPGADNDTPRALEEAAEQRAAGAEAAGGPQGELKAVDEGAQAAPAEEPASESPTSSTQVPGPGTHAQAPTNQPQAAPGTQSEPAGTRAPSPAQARVAAWAGRQVRTNPEYAQWILDAGRHGFATFAYNSAPQLRTYAAGGRHAMTGEITRRGQVVRELGGTIDGSAGAALLPMLATTHAIIAARAQEWLADPTKAKRPLTILWLARNWQGDAHNRARSLDASGGIAWGNDEAGPQVAQVLESLPAGSYLIGLPYQRPFFDPLDSLLHFTNDADREARRTGRPPADVTTPGLVEWRTELYTATWSQRRREWVRQPAAGSVLDRIRDAGVRRVLGGIPGRTFALMPDRPGHIHIQHRS